MAFHQIFIFFFAMAVGICVHSDARALVRSGPGVESAFQLTPKVSAGLRSGLCAGVLPFQPWKTMSSWSLLCSQEHCHPGTVMDLLVPVKGNTGCKGLSLQMCASNFGARVLAVMLRCPQMFGHVAY